MIKEIMGLGVKLNVLSKDTIGVVFKKMDSWYASLVPPALVHSPDHPSATPPTFEVPTISIYND